MKKAKTTLIIAASLIVLGLIVAFFGIRGFKYDFKALDTSTISTNTYTVKEDFSCVSLTDDATDVEFVISDSGECKVVCTEDEKELHSVTVKDDILVIGKDADAEKRWNWNIGITLKNPQITVYLPAREYDSLNVKLSAGSAAVHDGLIFKTASIETDTGDVSVISADIGNLFIDVSTGDLKVKEISSDTVHLAVTTGYIEAEALKGNADIQFSATTGDVKLRDISCGSIRGKTETGDILLENTAASGEIKCECDTGSVRLYGIDAGSLSFHTDTGDVTGTVLSDKIYIVETDTGDIDVPYSTNGGTCEISTDTGDIMIKRADG